jgi:uncharacterized protein (DUF433 family)
MIETPVTYVTQLPEGGWRVTGSRVSLDSIVHAYLGGESPEAITESFPTLSLEQIHGAIAFYLRCRNEIDQHLVEQDARREKLLQESEASHGPFLSRLRARREGGAKDPSA